VCRTRTGGTCNHAALCSTVIRYRAKGALRDVGKSLGMTEDLIKMLSSQVWGWSEEGVEAKHAEELNLNLEDRRLKLAIVLARELIGTPRHLSQHPGSFVLTHDRLDELVFFAKETARARWYLLRPPNRTPDGVRSQPGVHYARHRQAQSNRSCLAENRSRNLC
jgi:hypothetical protein